jgi:hypothetical protein
MQSSRRPPGYPALLTEACSASISSNGLAPNLPVDPGGMAAEGTI